MLQVQDTRFILNWRKQAGPYPSFDVLSSEIVEPFSAFRRFVDDAGLAPLELNQWEVTYVNRIHKGELWESPKDWPRIIPSLAFPPAGRSDIAGETFSSDWRYRIGDDRGRLYVALRHAKAAPTAEEFMQLTLTARGPISPDTSAADGFKLGRDAIVRTFTTMTSKFAQEYWRRRI
jgi:uncharacterized protein (TIGR04255 family)